MIKAILAHDDAYGVSRNGTLPWPDVPADLEWFEHNTRGGVVVMGSTTWRDPHMPRPMPDRINVLATGDPHLYPGADHYIAGDLVSGVRHVAESYPDRTVWIIGGPKTVSGCLGCIDQFYLSHIRGSYACDTHLDMDAIRSNYETVWTQALDAVTFSISVRMAI